MTRPDKQFEDVAREMDVLDARVRERDLAAEEDAPLHRDPFRIEVVPHRVEAEVEVDEGDEEERAGQE